MPSKDDLALTSQQMSGSFPHENQDMIEDDVMANTARLNSNMIFEDDDETNQIIQSYPKTSLGEHDDRENNPHMTEMSRIAH